MDGLWLALQESGFGDIVRRSPLLYPAANVLHVLAVMGFFALVAAMDMAILRDRGVEAVARLRSYAILLLLLVAATGLVLFTPEAVAVAANPAFQAKLVLILLALANVIANHWALRRSGGLARLTAGLSLLAWLAVAALGRLIAYV
jgi:hypothetical protein